MNGNAASDMVDRLLLFVGVVGPFVGAIIGVLSGIRGRGPLFGAAGGFLIGLLPTVIYGMWLLYGRIIDLMGLESALGFVLQLAAMAIAGFCLGAIGVALRKFIRRKLGPQKISRVRTGTRGER